MTDQINQSFRALSRSEKADFAASKIEYITDDIIGERCNDRPAEILPYVEDINLIDYLEGKGYEVIKL